MDVKLVLKQCPLFHALPEDALEALMALASRSAVSKGTEIFAQGDACRGFYIVGEGSVKVFRLSPAGREHILNVAHPGQTFGEAALFFGSDFPAYAEALEDTLLLYFSREEFMDLLESMPVISLRMLAGLSQWLRRLVTLLEDTVLMDVDARLARYLLHLALSHPVENRRGGKVKLPVQKQILAAHLATTPPTLSRAFARLEEMNLIQVNDQVIEFLNIEGLQNRASGFD